MKTVVLTENDFQTTHAKADKCDWMQCECCNGSGVISEHIESLNDLEKCQDCNGKGYTLEKIK